MTTAAVYLRISRDKTGEQLGVRRQRQDCVALCAEKRWTPVEYLDNDVSATTGKTRPKYEAMLSDIRDGRIGAVVCWDLDRLHRRPIELEAFMAIADEHRLKLATVSGDTDLSTAQGRLVARLKGSVARHEVEHKSDRQRRAAVQLAQRGEPKWRNAFGYMPDGSRQPDPVTAPLVRDAYASILAGGSISDVARAFNAAGHYGLTGRPWTAKVVSLFLRKARNAGLRSHNGEIVGPGNWPALVDETTWRTVQSVLNAPGRAPGLKSVRRHLLTSVLGCGKCGGYLAGRQTKMKAMTYQCKSCHGVSIRAEYVEPLLFGTVVERLAMPDAVDLLKAECHDDAQAEALRTEYNRLTTELGAIGVERGEGLLTGAQAKIATDVVLAKLEAIERAQTDAEKRRVLDGIPLGTPEVADAIAELSPDRFRAILDLLVRITVDPVGKGHRVDGARFDADRVRFIWR